MVKIFFNRLTSNSCGKRLTAKLNWKLQVLKHHPIHNDIEIQVVWASLNWWLDAKNKMWHQCSWILWITDGDRNTSFFHQKASNQKDRNSIRGICDATGQWQEDDHTTENIILDYFETIFRSNWPTDTSVLVDAVQPMVTDEMNTFLTRAFTTEEVHKALKQMHPKKSPGPDGMPPLFYQHFWSLTSECVTKTVLDFLNLGIIPPNFNETYIVLIPKTKNPINMTQYRPISLCKVISRLTSKVIANRLKRFLSHIVSENQSAFMSDYLITDNIIVAFETMHHLNQKRVRLVRLP